MPLFLFWRKSIVRMKQHRQQEVQPGGHNGSFNWMKTFSLWFKKWKWIDDLFYLMQFWRSLCFDVFKEKKKIYHCSNPWVRVSWIIPLHGCLEIFGVAREGFNKPEEKKFSTVLTLTKIAVIMKLNFLSQVRVVVDEIAFPVFLKKKKKILRNVFCDCNWACAMLTSDIT